MQARKSPQTKLYRAFVTSLAPSVRPRCQLPYSSQARAFKNAVAPVRAAAHPANASGARTGAHRSAASPYCVRVHRIDGHRHILAQPVPRRMRIQGPASPDRLSDEGAASEAAVLSSNSDPQRKRDSRSASSSQRASASITLTLAGTPLGNSVASSWSRSTRPPSRSGDCCREPRAVRRLL